MDDFLVKELQRVSLSMFRKNFIGIFHGSISAKVEYNKFIINKKEAIFDEITQNDLIDLYSKKDYRWNEASLDAQIHLNIYENISDAKFICYTMPPFVTAYSLNNATIVPKDYFGLMAFKEIEVYEPKQFEDWYERADIEIYRYMKENDTNIIVIKGYGIYTYDRDINQMAKRIAILENSCKLLFYPKLVSHQIPTTPILS